MAEQRRRRRGTQGQIRVEGPRAGGRYDARHAGTQAAASGLELGVHGAVGGFLGAIAMALAAMAVAALTGRGALTPLRLPAGTFFGQAAMAGVGPVVVGTIVHLVTGIALGVVFALLLRGFRPGLVLWGMAFGALVWLLAEFALLPLVNPVMDTHTPPLLYLVDHLVFGAVLGSYLAAGTGR